MNLFDSHFHYTGTQSFQSYMSRLDRVNRYRLMCVGCSYAESSRARDLADDYDNVYFAAGVQPGEAPAYHACPIGFGEFWDDEKCRAVGEIGLDYYYGGETRGVQKTVLEQFLGIALEQEKPAILHCRDLDGAEEAYSDLYAMVSDFAASHGRFVLHCYSGSAEYAEKFLALGGFIGVTGMITFKKAENIRELQKIIPDDRLLIETDSPYLAPVPHRGEENHPAYLPLVAAKVAEVRGMTPDALAQLTFDNAGRFFGIGAEE